MKSFTKIYYCVSYMIMCMIFCAHPFCFSVFENLDMLTTADTGRGEDSSS